jgi:RNA polymerase sigma factor (sigma-70 family)
MSNKDKTDFQRYYEEFRDKGLFNAEEERQLLLRIKAGDEAAKNKFIVHNMRLVLSCVLRFVDSNDAKAMDLVSAGTLGLLKAIDDFKVEKNNRFSTYAVWWIQAKIRKTIISIQPKAHQHKSLHVKFRSMFNKLKEDLGHIPSQEEVFGALNWDGETVATFLHDADKQIIPLEKIESASEAGALNNDPLLIDDEAAGIQSLISSETYEQLEAALNELPPELEDIIRRHYGLGYETSETYDDLAKFYGYTRERIRQLENSGLRMLWRKMKSLESESVFRNQNN